MILADLFVSKNFIKVDEYYDLEIYFDTETNYFYELNGENEDGWVVKEFRPTHEKYDELIKIYRETIERKK